MTDRDIPRGEKTVDIRRYLEKDEALAERAIDPDRPITLRQAWPEAQKYELVECDSEWLPCCGYDREGAVQKPEGLFIPHPEEH